MKATTQQIPVDMVDPHPQQPRIVFDDAPLGRLAESIDDPGVGLINPITVRKRRGRFELLSGERRLRAAKKAGWLNIDARIVEADEASALLILLVANLEAEQLNCIERGQALANLAAAREDGGAGMTHVEIAKRLGRSAPYVTNSVRLLRLPEPWRSDVLAGKLKETKARCLLPYVEQPEILDAIRRDIEQNAWAWRTRDDWERNAKLVAQRVICVNDDPTPEEISQMTAQRAARPLRGDHSAQAIGNTASAPRKPQEPAEASLTTDEALQLLEPYRGRPADLAAIRDAAELLLAETDAR